MSFSLDTRKVKYLHNYEAALRHHDSITPVRNSNCRPVAERRKTHFNIRKHGDSIIVRLYTTDIVTYTPDNKITLNMGNWRTNPTRAAIHAVTGVTIQGTNPIWAQDHDGKHYKYENNMQLQAGDYYRNHKIINPIHPVVHHLNKQTMKALHKDYAPFTKHLSGFIKLVGETGFDKDMLEGVPWTMPNQTILYLAKGTHVQMHEAALFIACSVKKNPGYYTPITVRLKDALAKFDEELIQAHKDTVLTRTTVTDGRVVKDRYAWAVG